MMSSGAFFGVFGVPGAADAPSTCFLYKKSRGGGRTHMMIYYSRITNIIIMLQLQQYGH